MNSRKHRITVLGLGAISSLSILVGCSRENSYQGGTTEGTQSSSQIQRNEPPATPPNSSAAANMENTARNARDRAGDTLTPLDQGNNETDLNITKEIRKSIVVEKGPDAHSVSARNIKIITKDGVVTLRGIVRTVGEK